MRSAPNLTSRICLTVSLLLTPVAATSQAPAAPAAQRAPSTSGTVKAVAPDTLTVTSATGQDYTVTVPSGTPVLEVAPGSRDLKSATPGQLSDIVVGDKVIVTGTLGDTPPALNAKRVILMKSAAIADAHAAESAAWTQGGGGIVKSVNPSTGAIVVSSGLKTLTVQTVASTIVRRYSGSSVRYEDAGPSTHSAIQPGDQLRVRGAKSADGASIQADEIVTGSFHNYSGIIASIDSSAATLTLTDLATKRKVSVAVTPNSDLRRLPPQAAAMMAARMKGTAAAPGATAAGSPDARQRTGRAGMDLSSMLSRLPTETLGGLKPGEAVMIVATTSDSGTSNAITLLAGVEPILAAAPAGESMTLSPWSVGGAAPEGGEGPQ